MWSFCDSRRENLIAKHFLYLGTLGSLLHSCAAQTFNSTAANTTSLGVSWPDLVQCSPVYGVSLNGGTCRGILSQIYPGKIPRFLRFVKQKKGGSSTTFQVPVEYKDAESECARKFYYIVISADRGPMLVKPQCMVTIDLAGPAWKDDNKLLLSSTLRDMIESVISSCVDTETQGGFASYGLRKTADNISPSPRGGFGRRAKSSDND